MNFDQVFAGIVYVLCALTSLSCAVLLLRSYVKRHVRLLLWSGLCFCGLTLNNFILFADLYVFPQIDLSIVRTLPALLGVVVLIVGMIWDSR